MKDVTVLTGPPGCGKSDRLREDVIRRPGLYLFCAPTIPLIKEQVARFAAEAPSIQVHRADSGRGRGTVQRHLDDARAAIAASGVERAVVFATHDALMMRDLTAFMGWHVRIDEAPNAAKSGTISMGQSRSFFEARLDLAPVGDTGWSGVSLKGAATSWVDWSKDHLTKPLVDFFKLVSGPSGVFVNVADWNTVDRFDWWSIWTPASLADFASIQIAGASYRKSLGAIVARKWFANLINLVDQPAPYVRSGQPAIRVHYFTSVDVPATTLWDSSEGRRRIKAVCDHLATHVPDLGYWSGNDDVLKLMEWRLAGDCTAPKVAGQNKWRMLTKCAFIYSSQAVPADRPLQETFGISKDEIRAAREDEDILQFAMRGAIRNKDFDGEYDIYLYSQRQAEGLADLLREHGVGRSVDMIPVPEAGIMDVVDQRTSKASFIVPAVSRASKSPPARVMSPTGKLVLPKSLQRNTARAKAREQAPKKRGRPQKATKLGAHIDDSDSKSGPNN